MGLGRRTRSIGWMATKYVTEEVHQFTESRGTAYEGGLWWQVDLGVTYWVDDAFMWQKQESDLQRFNWERIMRGLGIPSSLLTALAPFSGDMDFSEWIFEPEWTNIREYTAALSLSLQ